MEFLLTAAGLAILLISGDLLVRGAVAVSLRFGVPTLIVSLTIVAFGTSAPEMLIAVKAALANAPGLALGNVVGSNIANVLLVLGVPALISRIDPRDSDTRGSYAQMLGVTAIFIVLLFLGPLTTWHGAVLLALLALMLAGMVREARAARGAAEDDLPPRLPLWRGVLYLAVGIVGLPLGADILVDAARSLALDFGISDEVIGLTVVAVGTSLPELATTVMAALRREADVALGNVIGSNMFNILAIMGVTSFFGPLAVNAHMLRFDIWVMAAAALALLPFVYLGGRLSRPVGLAFLAAYAIYTISLF